MDAPPTRRREVVPIRCAFVGADALELEIAAEGELVGGVDRLDQELLGVSGVVWRAGVEELVPLAGELLAGVEDASVGLVSDGLCAAKVVEDPQIRFVVIVFEEVVVFRADALLPAA